MRKTTGEKRETLKSEKKQKVELLEQMSSEKYTTIVNYFPNIIPDNCERCRKTPSAM